VTNAFDDIASTWRPAPTSLTGTADGAQVHKLAAFLGVEPPSTGDALPPLWHEVLLRDATPMNLLGEDGHPQGGALLPPLPDRRRMFGGSTVQVTAPLRMGEAISRKSEVTDVRATSGRSGDLLVVTEEHQWTAEGADRFHERRQIVYRRAADIGAQPVPSEGAAPDDVTWSVAPDQRHLFAYSALTYNLHRIHYDAPYATGVEGHPALVVHGPLLALWCSEQARTQLGILPSRVEFTLTSTAYLGHEVSVTTRQDDDGLQVEAWSQGRRCIQMACT
jgi:3-methylfumaryl-CoA hydratase